MDWLEIAYFGNSLGRWSLAAAVAVLTVVLLVVLRAVAIARLQRFAESTDNTVDDLLVDVVRRTKLFALLALGLALGSRLVVAPAQAATVVRAVVTLALGYQLGLWGNGLIRYWLGRQFAAPVGSSSANTGYGAIKFVARGLLWGVLALMVLDNLGIEVTALMAGLGVGGIAIALAVQNILGDMFCSLSIVIDKPFEIGDFIIVGDLMGSVENIGIKTTRVRSLGGEQLVFANSDLVSSRIRNYKRMRERRIVFEFGVTYQTPVELVEKIPVTVRELCDSVDGVRLDRVHFKSYGDSALIFEVVYYVTSPDYNTYMDLQQTINLALMREFERDKIEFAYPTQTLYLHQEA